MPNPAPRPALRRAPDADKHPAGGQSSGGKTIDLRIADATKHSGFIATGRKKLSQAPLGSDPDLAPTPVSEPDAQLDRKPAKAKTKQTKKAKARTENTERSLKKSGSKASKSSGKRNKKAKVAQPKATVKKSAKSKKAGKAKKSNKSVGKAKKA